MKKILYISTILLAILQTKQQIIGEVRLFTLQNCPQYWEEYTQAQNRYLRASSPQLQVGSTGGSNSITLNLENLPPHFFWTQAYASHTGDVVGDITTYTSVASKGTISQDGTDISFTRLAYEYASQGTRNNPNLGKTNTLGEGRAVYFEAPYVCFKFCRYVGGEPPVQQQQQQQQQEVQEPEKIEQEQEQEQKEPENQDQPQPQNQQQMQQQPQEQQMDIENQIKEIYEQRIEHLEYLIQEQQNTLQKSNVQNNNNTENTQGNDDNPQNENNNNNNGNNNGGQNQKESLNHDLLMKSLRQQLMAELQQQLQAEKEEQQELFEENKPDSTKFYVISIMLQILVIIGLIIYFQKYSIQRYVKSYIQQYYVAQYPNNNNSHQSISQQLHFSQNQQYLQQQQSQQQTPNGDRNQQIFSDIIRQNSQTVPNQKQTPIIISGRVVPQNTISQFSLNDNTSNLNQQVQQQQGQDQEEDKLESINEIQI